MTPPDPSTHWHLDKRVPLAMISAIIFQTASFVWWAAGIDRTVADHDRRIASIETWNERAARSDVEVAERLARLEERSAASLYALQRIEALLSGRIHGDPR